MSSMIARFSFCFVSLLTIGLSVWKSSEINQEVYLDMEGYVGGAMTLHFIFSLLIGFLSVFTFPRLASANKSDVFGIRLLFCLLLIISIDEFSQLFISNRTFSFNDLSINWTGMLLGYFSAKTLKFLRKHN